MFTDIVDGAIEDGYDVFMPWLEKADVEKQGPISCEKLRGVECDTGDYVQHTMTVAVDGMTVDVRCRVVPMVGVFYRTDDLLGMQGVLGQVMELAR